MLHTQPGMGDQREEKRPWQTPRIEMAGHMSTLVRYGVHAGKSVVGIDADNLIGNGAPVDPQGNPHNQGEDTGQATEPRYP